MNDRSALDRLSDAKQYALEARDIARNLDERRFAENRRDQLAVQFCLMVAGEALSKVPPDIRVLASDVPWTAINGLRNRLVHGYFLTDNRIILTIAQDRTGPLALAIDRLIEKIK